MKVMLCTTPNHKHVIVQDSCVTPIKDVITEDSLKNVLHLMADNGHHMKAGTVKKELFTTGKCCLDFFEL